MIAEIQNEAVLKKAKTALFKLIKTKPFDSVTVTDITEECNFSRQYFYRFFTDKFALVRAIFELDLKAALGNELYSSHKVASILRTLYDNKAFYRSIIDSSSYMFLYTLFYQSGEAFLRAIIDVSQNRERMENLKDSIQFYLTGITTTLFQMLYGKDCRSPEEISSVFLENMPSSLAFLKDEQTTADYILFKVHKQS